MVKKCGRDGTRMCDTRLSSKLGKTRRDYGNFITKSLPKEANYERLNKEHET